MKISKQLLVIAGILSFAVALFQAVITFSPSWSRYFGAPEELVSNVPLLYGTGLTIAMIFWIFGLYAMSGAGYICPLPLLRLGLLGIGSVCTLRGVLVFPLLFIATGCLHSSETVPPTGLASSLVSLLIGLLYPIGTIGSWRSLQSTAKR